MSMTREEIIEAYESAVFSSGMTPEETAKTIFGIDIMPDNIEEAKKRLLDILPGVGKILDKNIVCGDFLKPETVWFLRNEMLEGME